MAAGIVVKAVTSGLWAYGVSQSLQELWAVPTPNQIRNLSDDNNSAQPRLNNFNQNLVPFCTDFAKKLGCINSQIQLDPRIPTSDDNRWVTYPRGIDFQYRKPLIAINRDMLPNTLISTNPNQSNDPAELQKHRVCQFFIAQALADLKLDGAWKMTTVRVVAFVAAVYFLSPTWPIAAYVIGLIADRLFASLPRGATEYHATLLAVQHLPKEVSEAGIAHLRLMKEEISSLEKKKKAATFLSTEWRDHRRQKLQLERAYGNDADLQVLIRWIEDEIKQLPEQPK